MKILHLIKHCRQCNGNVHMSVDLACEQVEQGNQVYYVSSGGDFEELLESSGVIHFKVENPTIRSPLSLINTFYHLIKVVRIIKPDVLHAHMMLSALQGWLIKLIFRIPLVTTVHNSFDKHSILMGLGNRVVCVSKAVLEEMESRGISKSKLRFVLNGTLGVKRRIIPLHKQMGFNLERISIATICGLHPRKGVDVLIKAFELVCKKTNQNCHLYIAGGGPHREEYEQLADKLNIGHKVHFLGAFLDTVSFLKQVDIFVLASLAEPAGLVLSESREAGCAVIASNVGGIPEMLDDGKAGTLVPPQDVEALANAIIELLEDYNRLNDSKMSSLSNLERFHISKVAESYAQIYQELVQV